MLYCAVFGLGFLLLGLLFATGKLLAKIPGWSGMPEKEKQSIRILPLCRNIGGAIALAGGLLLLGALFPGFREGGMRLAVLGWFLLCVADLVYIHKSGRYVRSGESVARTK